MITLNCPQCGHTMELDDGFLGGICRCSGCSAMITVPNDLGDGRGQVVRDGDAGGEADVPEGLDLFGDVPARGRGPSRGGSAVASHRPSPVAARRSNRGMTIVLIGGGLAAAVVLLVIVMLGAGGDDPETSTAKAPATKDPYAHAGIDVKLPTLDELRREIPEADETWLNIQMNKGYVLSQIKLNWAWESRRRARDRVADSSSASAPPAPRAPTPAPKPDPPAPAASPVTPTAQSGGATPSLSEGLLLHYPFDDPAALGRDAGGAGRHAQMSGTIQAAAGRFGGALRLDGADDRLEIPALPSNGMLSEFTLAMWFKGPPPRAKFVSLISQNEWRNHGIHWLLFDRGTTLRLALKDAGRKTDYDARIQLRPDHWHHLASSYHGPSRTVRFYLDGQRVGTAETQRAARGQLGPGMIGGWNVEKARALRGAIDDVRVYDRVLSDAEVRRLTVGE